MSKSKTGKKQSLESIEKRVSKLRDIPRSEETKFKISNNGKENRKPTALQTFKKVEAISRLSIINLNDNKYYTHIREALNFYNIRKLQGKPFDVKFSYNNYWLFLPYKHFPTNQEILNALLKYFNNKLIYCLEADKFFTSSREIANFLNIKCLSSINSHLNKHTKTAHGYHFNYCTEEQILKFIYNNFKMDEFYEDESVNEVK